MAAMEPAQFAARMREIRDASLKRGADREALGVAADHLLAELIVSLGYGEGAELYVEANLWRA